MHLNVKVVEILKLSGIEEHTFGPINLREHFPEEELALRQACTTYGLRATCGPRDLFLRPTRTQLQKMLQKPDFG